MKQSSVTLKIAIIMEDALMEYVIVLMDGKDLDVVLNSVWEVVKTENV